MFTCDIDCGGLGTPNIHYAPKKSEVENATPMLFIDDSTFGACRVDVGARLEPGYLLEVGMMLPLLTASSLDHPSLHVVAPRKPGFEGLSTQRHVSATAAHSRSCRST